MSHMASIDMPHLQAAINKESHEWLVYNAPDFATAVQNEINAGKTPAQIRMYVMRQTAREALALRCEQAACYLQAAGA